MLTAATVTALKQLAGDSRCRLFELQQESFAFQSACVAGEGSALSHDSVTGHNDTERISPDRLAYLVCGGAVTQFRGELTVGPGVPVGYAGQQIPHSFPSGI